MDTLNEKAVAEKVDLKTAAYNLVHDLRDYRQLGSLHKAVAIPVNQTLFTGNQLFELKAALQMVWRSDLSHGKIRV
jgi:hypothetical protein